MEISWAGWFDSALQLLVQLGFIAVRWFGGAAENHGSAHKKVLISSSNERRVAVKNTIWFAVFVLAISNVASATMTFQQLDENTFSISHKVKGFGGRGQAMDLVYEKAASLCIAAGYTHLELFGQDSNAPGFYQSANATLTVRFYQTDGEDRIACEMKASDHYIKQATAKLKKRGYKGPVQVVESTEPEPDEAVCTVEQITAMVKAGMSEEQIQAACRQK